MMDPPQHTRYRKLVSRRFTARVVKALEPRIRERAVYVLDATIAKSTCDFVVDVAADLPQLVIVDLLGIPAEDRSTAFDWMRRITAATIPSSHSPTTAQPGRRPGCS
jgi:cytochrome P450